MAEGREITLPKEQNIQSINGKEPELDLRLKHAELQAKREVLRNEGKVIDLAKEIVGGMRDVLNHKAILARLESEKDKIELEIQKIAKQQEMAADKGEQDLQKLESFSKEIELMVKDYIPNLIRDLGIPEDHRASIVTTMMSKLPELRIQA